MGYEVTCTCGKVLSVSEGMAGSSMPCGCGRAVSVPSLSELRRQEVTEPHPVRSRKPRSTADKVFGYFVGTVLVGALIVLGTLLSFAAGSLAGLGYLVAMLGQVWLLVLVIRECDRRAIILALVIPFFTWYFAYQRWDVAKWPLLINVAGVLVNLFGLLSGA